MHAALSREVRTLSDNWQQLTDEYATVSYRRCDVRSCALSPQVACRCHILYNTLKINLVLLENKTRFYSISHILYDLNATLFRKARRATPAKNPLHFDVMLCVVLQMHCSMESTGMANSFRRTSPLMTACSPWHCMGSAPWYLHTCLSSLHTCLTEQNSRMRVRALAGDCATAVSKSHLATAVL